MISCSKPPLSLRSIKMKFEEGTEVLARHPSTDEFLKGKVLSVRGDSYRIKFETGNERTIHSNDVKISRPSRSTAKSSSLGKKSPTRSGKKSPSRRSPGRSSSSSKQASSKSTKFAKISLPRIQLSDDAVKTDNTVSKRSTKDEDFFDPASLQSQLKEMSTVTRRSTRLFSGALKPESDHKMVMLTRNINRAVSLPLERKSQLFDFNFIEGKERGHSVQRDQDLLKTLNYEEDVDLSTQVMEKREKEINIVSEPQEWGGWLGSLILIFLLPLSTILPQLMCTEKRCSFGYPNITTDLNTYINLEAFVAYLGYLLFVAISSIIPVGRKIYGPQSRMERLQYRSNGFLSAVLSLFVLIMCIYQDIKVTDFIIENCVQLSISGWIIGTILSVLLFLKSDNAPIANLNIHGSTNSTIYNFWQGREINPRIGPIDFKLCLFRSSLIAVILVNLSIVIKTVEEAESYSLEHLNVSVLLTCLLQIIYAMDTLFFESAILTTFEIMYEGTGYMLCVGYFLFPFLPTLTTKYMLYHKTQLSYLNVLPVLPFIIGYLLYRISNLQKNEFRQNPLSPSLAHLETIPTIRGTKLIVSGLWGYVRHPNYLGDIIMWWSISCTSLACDVLPYYYAVMCTALLVHRAVRDNERCKMRYGLAWEQYISRVRYMILYRIF
nr:delta(14)-sterol reductase TM7SF2 isoform X2 [Osmia lignaria]